VSIQTLRVRLKRLTPPPRPVIGEDLHRDAHRRRELSDKRWRKGLTAAQKKELAALDAYFEHRDLELKRKMELWSKYAKVYSGGEPLTDAERIELEELEKRYAAPPEPPRPNERFALALKEALEKCERGEYSGARYNKG
jgi:hypothetical protein